MDLVTEMGTMLLTLLQGSRTHSPEEIKPFAMKYLDYLDQAHGNQSTLYIR